MLRRLALPSLGLGHTGLIPLGVEGPAGALSPWEVEAGGSGVQGRRQLCREFKVSLGCKKIPSQKKKRQLAGERVGSTRS